MYRATSVERGLTGGLEGEKAAGAAAAADADFVDDDDNDDANAAAGGERGGSLAGRRPMTLLAAPKRDCTLGISRGERGVVVGCGGASIDRGLSASDGA
jgi:hypothetical protein